MYVLFLVLLTVRVCIIFTNLMYKNVIITNMTYKNELCFFLFILMQFHFAQSPISISQKVGKAQLKVQNVTSAFAEVALRFNFLI